MTILPSIMADTVMTHLLMGTVVSVGPLDPICSAMQEAALETGAKIPTVWSQPDLLPKNLSLFLPPELLQERLRASFTAGAVDAASGSGSAVSDSAENPASLRFVSHHADIFSAMNRARRERWGLKQFADWLQATLAEDSKRKYLWGVFKAVIDMEVLSGERKRPRARLSLAETKAYSGYYGDRTTISRWIHRYERLATDLGETRAIRPAKSVDAALVERMGRGSRRETLFEEASRFSGNKAPRLFHLLTEAGLVADALVASNVLIGIHEGQRLPASELETEEFGQRTLAHIERRFEGLAAKYGFAIKERPAVSAAKSQNVQWGRKCQKIFRTAKQEGWDCVRFLEMLRRHPQLNQWMGPQAEVGWDIVARAIRYATEKETTTPYAIHQKEFAPRGIARVTFYGWWRKAMVWIEGLGLPNERNGVITFIISQFQEADQERKDPAALRRELLGRISPNGLIILFDKIGKGAGSTEIWATQLEKILKVPRKEVLMLIREVRIYFRIEEEKRNLELDEDLRARISAARDFADPRAMVRFVESLKDNVVLSAFHDTVIGTGSDTPRVYISTLQKQLRRLRRSDRFHLEQWERFWADQAGGRGWKAKPKRTGPAAAGEILMGIDYAKAVGWDFSKFRAWLQKAAAERNLRYLLTVFDGVIDEAVMTGRRRKSDYQARIVTMQKETGKKSGTLDNWVRIWEAFAREMGWNKGLRPKTEDRVRLAEMKRQNKNLEPVFQAAAGTRQNRAEILRQALEREGLELYAAVAANILEGIEEGPRLPTQKVVVPGHSETALVHATARVEGLAKKYQFPIKPVPPSSLRLKAQAELSKKLGELLERVKRERWNAARLLAHLRTNEELRRRMAHPDSVADLFDRRIEILREGSGSIALNRLFVAEFEPRGFPRGNFYQWWHKFTEWIALCPSLLSTTS